MTSYRGREEGAGLRVCVVVSRFNAMVTDRLLAGARRALRAGGVPDDAVDVISVPGAWELTPAVRAATGRRYDAVVALGCVVRGETPHFDYICRSVTDGLTALNRAQDTPISFGVLTTENVAQGLARTGGDVGDKGEEAARAALELADLLRRWPREP